MKSHYSCIVLGGGFYGCGLAAGRSDCLVVEPEIAVGSDFAFSFAGSSCPARADEAWNPLVRELYDELQKRQALREGRLHLGALVPVFSQWCRQQHLDLHLSCQILAATAQRVVIRNVEGEVVLTADAVIDARPQTPRLVTAAVQLTAGVVDGEYGPLQLSSGPLPGEGYVQMELLPGESWPQARRRLEQAWEERPPLLADCRYLLTGSRYFASPFANPFVALQAGLARQLPSPLLPPPPPVAAPTGRYDVIIAGFGTAGAHAAIAAGRRGLRCLILERNTYPGGTQTGGFIWGYYIQKPTGLTAEIAETVNRRCAEGRLGRQPVENRKFLFEEEALRYGAEIRYSAVVTGVSRDGDRVSGVVWLENGHLLSADAPVVIDATAEADLCVLAGAPTTHGRESDGQFQPFTCSFAVNGEISVSCWNFDAGCLDQTCAAELSETLLHCPAVHLHDDYCVLPRRLLAPADLPGIREGRRIVSRRQVCFADFVAGRLDDSETIDYVYSNLDSHAKDFALESENYQDWIIGSSMWGPELVIPVPLGALFPVGVTGLIAAARHLGVDHDFGHAVRMNAGMGRAGECAGILAFLAKRQGCLPHEVAYHQLLAEMPVQSPSPLSQNLRYTDLGDDEIRAGLAGDCPGAAIWSARHRRRLDLLRECLAAEGDDRRDLRRHAAFALALLDDRSALPELRACLRERDPFLPRTSRKENHRRGYVAAFLLGRLRDADSIGLLADCLQQNEGDDLYQYHSYAFTALLKIGEAHPERRPQVAEILRRRAEDPHWYLAKAMHLTDNIRRMDSIYRLHIAAALKRWGIPNRIMELLPLAEFCANDRGIARRLGLT